METKNAYVNTFLVELKRGTITLAVLSQLKEPEYGYSLLEKLVNMKHFVVGELLMIMTQPGRNHAVSCLKKMHRS